jgi:hypothetical protein
MIIGLYERKVSKEIMDRAIAISKGTLNSTTSSADLNAQSSSSIPVSKINSRITTTQRGPASSNAVGKAQDPHSISETLKSQFEGKFYNIQCFTQKFQHKMTCLFLDGEIGDRLLKIILMR